MQSMNSTASNFYCPDSKSHFTSENNFRTHVQNHGKKDNLECDTSKKDFPNKCHLKRHIISQTGEKSYKCLQCQKTFTATNRSNKYIYSRSKKKFLCEVCGKLFVAKSSLKKHNRIHENKKPHICGICGKSYVNKISLEQHMRKTLVCKEFSLGSNLNRHFRKGCSKQNPTPDSRKIPPRKLMGKRLAQDDCNTSDEETPYSNSKKPLLQAGYCYDISEDEMYTRIKMNSTAVIQEVNKYDSLLQEFERLALVDDATTWTANTEVLEMAVGESLLINESTFKGKYDENALSDCEMSTIDLPETNMLESGMDYFLERNMFQSRMDILHETNLFNPGIAFFT